MIDVPQTAPAAERNKGPILAVLKQVLPSSGLVLELASGTGQHVVHFAREMPHLTWQPSEPDPGMRASIRAWIAQAGLTNVHAPLDLDVRFEPWPLGKAQAVLCINMIHISPWAATAALMAGAARVLHGQGALVLYGPYRRFGRHTAPSNEMFDEHLRSSNPEWSVRDLEAVVEMAQSNGLAMQDAIEMPANNLSVVFRPAPSRS
jgi:SAM-dependent methyltransferase